MVAVKEASDPTARFFEALAERGDEPLLRKAHGTTRFEIIDGRRPRLWFVTVERGHVSVSRRSATHDCVVRADKALFDGIVSGQVNVVAAVLRGELAIAGDWRLLVWMQRLFRGSRVRGRAGAGGRARRRG